MAEAACVERERLGAVGAFGERAADGEAGGGTGEGSGKLEAGNGEGAHEERRGLGGALSGFFGEAEKIDLGGGEAVDGDFAVEEPERLPVERDVASREVGAGAVREGEGAEAERAWEAAGEAFDAHLAAGEAGDEPAEDFAAGLGVGAEEDDGEQEHGGAEGAGKREEKKFGDAPHRSESLAEADIELERVSPRKPLEREGDVQPDRADRGIVAQTAAGADADGG